MNDLINERDNMKVMFKNVCCIFIVVIFGSSSIAIASEFSTNQRLIQKIRFYPAERPQHTGYQDVAIVTLASGTISGDKGTCSSMEFAVLNSDKSLISVLLAARIARLPISVAVEKNLTHGNGTFCRIVKVEM